MNLSIKYHGVDMQLQDLDLHLDFLQLQGAH